uniref:Uncharacterized protein n=1 Tax=Panagrolaimus sp. JU765 TaxID=591449 RepID=A0AC34QBL2_9BILA
MNNYFSLFCGNQSLLEHAVYNNTTSTIPHIAECYQQSILVFIPSFFLIIFTPLVLYSLYKSNNGPLKFCSFATLRILISIILLVNVFVLLGYGIIQRLSTGNEPSMKYLIAYGILHIALCIAFVLALASRNRGLVSSGVLFNFWLLLAICGFSEFRHKLNIFLYESEDEQEDVDRFRFYLFMIYYPLVLLQLLASCFADSPRYKIADKKLCPELYSSFLSQITFNWFTGLAITGYKRPLESDDLWDLNPRDTSKHLLQKFQKNYDDHLDTADISRDKRPSWFAVPENAAKSRNIQGRQIYISEPPSIIMPLFKTFRWPFLAGAFYKLLFDLMQFVPPQVLKHLINFIENEDQPLWVGVGLSLFLFTVALVQSMILHQYFHNMFRLGMNIRSILTSVVYRKALFLSNKARKNRTVGEIVNLMAVDIQRIQDLTSFINLFWSAPLQIILSVYFLMRLLGVAVIGGLAVLILMAPLNYFISIKMRDFQVQQMKFKDERLKMTAEALNGMKVLKLYAWEESMQKMILDIRRKEIKILRKLAYLNAATAMSWSCAPFLVAVVTFGVYVTIDPENNVLTPQITFVALSLFNILRFPLAILAMIMGQAVQSHVSNKRLKSFLAENEIEHLPAPDGIKSDVAVGIKNGLFQWDDGEEFKLQNINLTVRKGSLVAVVGRIGCGKSSLLSAILGELQCVDGGVAVSGSVAYVPQQPWIQNMSLKKNILFNQSYHERLYDQVLESCSLTTDLDALPAGDETEIGEKGINLSGGQKQRVSLARAVYSQKDIYLLDDPLSAVDAHVGKHIFDNVIANQTGLLKYHTRILVTHGLHYLKHCDQIVVMKDGRISESGSYQDLINSSGEFATILEEFLIEEAKNRARSVSFGEDADEVKEVLQDLEKLDPRKKQAVQRQISENIERLSPPVTADGPRFDKKTIDDLEKAPLINNISANGTMKKDAPPTTNEKSKLIEKEGMETGKVKFSVYWDYLRAIGLKITVFFFMVYVLSSILGVYSNLYLADWSDHAVEIQRGENGSSGSQTRIVVYAFLGVGQVVFVCVASIIMALGMVIASRTLHEKMLTNILRSPMSFFDVTPLGRILNRFGKDINLMDTSLPASLINMISMVIQAIFIISVPIIVTPFIVMPLIPVLYGYFLLLDVDGLDAAIPRSLLSFVRTMIASVEILGVIAYATPMFLLPASILAIIYFLVLRFYVSTSRQLKRLESTTRSPIYSHFQESIQGATSIRAYHCTEHFLIESQKKVDNNLITYYPSIVANRWLAVRLELVGNLIVLLSALLAVLMRGSPGITAGLVGLSVAYAFNITQTLNWAVRMTSELETNVVAIERIKEYSETPTEAALETKIKLSKQWPSRGSVNFEELQIRYRPELDLVLKGISAHIRSEEKVGIVGRTGAGKSSLMMALFRLVEPSSGKILIDGVDISMIGLADLRSRLTIVPQDPVLFSGTLRTNLDPFKKHTDEELWRVLKLTHMDTYVASLTDLLDHKVSEGGENLSVGQRQLICLARALLRKSKLLVLDEAAASVDMETDQLIQRTIREQFADCTVLTIAHRLHSVVDSDRLMVLDAGRISEFDNPQTLLSLKNSVFHSMAIDAGLVSG